MLPLATAPIRKAAALAHRLPGVSLVVRQTDWPPLLVSDEPWSPPDGQVWIEVSPTCFRDELRRLDDGASRLVGPSLLDADADVGIEVHTDGVADVDDFGLFVIEASCEVRWTGFATLAAISVPAPTIERPGRPSPRVRRCDRQCPLVSTLDIGLGTQLIGCSYVAADDDHAEAARTTIIDALVSATVDEAILHSSPTG
ncbi:MAG: hypothetical protein AAGA99_10645 [Actinomycetota bacterium]